MKRFLMLLLAGMVAAPLGAISERPVSVRGVRALGMGDAFTAVADDQNVFFYNPAGTVQRTGSLVSIFELPVSIGADFFDAADFISDNENDLSNFDTLTPQRQIDLTNKIADTMIKLDPRIGVGVFGPNYLSGPIGNGWHWGVGIFNQVDASFKLLDGIIAPTMDYDINFDVVPMANVAKRFEDLWILPGKLGVGANLKIIRRGQTRDERVSVLQLEDFDNPPVQVGSGFGIDLGALYQLTDRINLGVAVLDFLGTSLNFESIDAEKGFIAKPSESRSIPARWNVGVSWTPEKLGVGPIGIPTGSRLTLSADVKDILNADDKVLFSDGFIADTAWKHIHLGAEYRWWFLRGRLGANQGYPSIGLGLDIPFLKVDYAFYSDELGRFAGDLEQSNHMISLALRWGSGKTESRERIAGEEGSAN